MQQMSAQFYALTNTAGAVPPLIVLPKTLVAYNVHSVLYALFRTLVTQEADAEGVGIGNNRSIFNDISICIVDHNYAAIAQQAQAIQ